MRDFRICGKARIWYRSLTWLELGNKSALALRLTRNYLKGKQSLVAPKLLMFYNRRAVNLKLLLGGTQKLFLAL